MNNHQWAHPIPDRHHFAHSQAQADWAIAERLETIAEQLASLNMRLEEIAVVGGNNETALRIYAITSPQ